MREEEKKRSSQDSSFKRFMKKRWAFPAIYIASAAIILTAVLWYQNGSSNNTDNYDYEATDISGKKHQEPAIEVNRAMENFVMPVKDPDAAVIQKQFYDYDGKKEEQEAALVFYNNTYHPNTGIDITTKDGKSFEVLAALSGTVTKVQEDTLLGNVIEIEHDKGIVTQYQSVTEMNVEVGDQVEQGDSLAKAGESVYNEEAGIHTHFEIRKDGIPVNPLDFFNKPLSSLQELDTTDEATTEENSAAEENNKEEATPSEEGAEEEATPSEEGEAVPSEEQSEEDATTSEEQSQEKADKTEEDKSTDTEEDPAGSSEEGSQTDDQTSEEATDSTDA